MYHYAITNIKGGIYSMKDIAWQNFLEKCLTIKTLKELELFFDVLLTHSERDELPKRLAILQELLKDVKPQRMIAKDLKVSIANVSRGANVLKVSSVDLKKLIL
jgi:Trp operon repressor